MSCLDDFVVADGDGIEVRQLVVKQALERFLAVWLRSHGVREWPVVNIRFDTNWVVEIGGTPAEVGIRLVLDGPSGPNGLWNALDAEYRGGKWKRLFGVA